MKIKSNIFFIFYILNNNTNYTLKRIYVGNNTTLSCYVLHKKVIFESKYKKFGGTYSTLLAG